MTFIVKHAFNCFLTVMNATIMALIVKNIKHVRLIIMEMVMGYFIEIILALMNVFVK